VSGTASPPTGRRARRTPSQASPLDRFRNEDSPLPDIAVYSHRMFLTIFQIRGAPGQPAAIPKAAAGIA
jgi:hypothetical protein